MCDYILNVGIYIERGTCVYIQYINIYIYMYIYIKIFGRASRGLDPFQVSEKNQEAGRDTKKKKQEEETSRQDEKEAGSKNKKQPNSKQQGLARCKMPEARAVICIIISLSLGWKNTEQRTQNSTQCALGHFLPCSGICICFHLHHLAAQDPRGGHRTAGSVLVWARDPNPIQKYIYHRSIEKYEGHRHSA